jgi:hypothetical protein
MRGIQERQPPAADVLFPRRAGFRNGSLSLGAGARGVARRNHARIRMSMWPLISLSKKKQR